MGGHGGLNILPQKRWNVYNRDNRLKVARDEAKYEEEQAGVRERAEAADRERRRQLLLERARERYGKKTQALPGSDAHEGQAALDYPPGHAEQQQLEQQGGDWQPDAVALRGLSSGQADHFAALEQQLGQQQQQQQKQWQQAGEEEGQRARKRPRERAVAGPPPTLAQLAAQMDSTQDAPQVQAGGEQALAAPQHAGKLQRFNLFAEEEEASAAAKRKNPEAEAERRDERRRRGDANTQTSDARFDEQFSFAHKLYGQQAMPWYAKKGSTLPAAEQDGGPGTALEQQQPAGGRKQMWHWEMQARAALAGVPPSQQAQQQARQQQQQQPLLAGIKVVPAGGGKRSRGSRGGSTSSESSDNSSSEDSSSGSSSSDEDSDSSSDRRRRRRQRSRKDDGRGSGERKSKRGQKEGRKQKRRGKGKDGGKDGGKRREGGKSVEELRLERLKREEAERVRQQRVVAAAAGRDPALGGKKFHQSFGFGR